MKNESAMRRRAAALVLALAGLGTAPTAMAADATAQLRQFVTQVKSASGEFRQQAEGTGPGAAPQSGVFAFERPGRFRWEVKAPHEQLVLADGKRVYQYDPDLAQVTERGLAQAVGASPAALLFGSGKLEDSFTLQSLPDQGGLSWLRATPRSAEAGFTHVDIGFRDALPQRLLLLDAFGQTTRIDLLKLKPNPALAPDTFLFKAPENTDVVRMP